MTPNDLIIAKTNSCRARFASGFLRKLMKVKKSRSAGPESVEEIRKFGLRIKMVAYSSMAQAVGTRRAWSRAILFKLKNRAMCQGLMKRKRSICLAAKKKDGNKKSVVRVDDEVPQANKLRQLVPGGKSMDICSLLEETAHYVKCLTTQVKVMKTIVDHFYE